MLVRTAARTHRLRAPIRRRQSRAATPTNALKKRNGGASRFAWRHGVRSPDLRAISGVRAQLIRCQACGTPPP